jgi:hypothetical protein
MDVNSTSFVIKTKYSAHCRNGEADQLVQQIED